MFFNFLMVYGCIAKEKSVNLQDLIMDLQVIIQNQTHNFNKEIQFLKMENTAKKLRIHELEKRSLVQQEVIEKLRRRFRLECKHPYEGSNCDTCAFGYFGYPFCQRKFQH